MRSFLVMSRAVQSAQILVLQTLSVPHELLDFRFFCLVFILLVFILFLPGSAYWASHLRTLWTIRSRYAMIISTFIFTPKNCARTSSQ